MADTIKSSSEGHITFSDTTTQLFPDFDLVIPDVDSTTFTKTAAEAIATQTLQIDFFLAKDGTAVSTNNGYTNEGNYIEEQTVTIFDIS